VFMAVYSTMIVGRPRWKLYAPHEKTPGCPLEGTTAL